MSSAKSLAGLMKWLDHEDWRHIFFSVVDQHFGACKAHGLEPKGLEPLLGDAGFTNLWGCAFEDFLTQHESDGRNIVDEYLKRRGWKETATNKRYMTALQHAVMSLYEVSDIVPGQSFLARDLLRGGEPVRVHERSGTNALRQWDRIGARLIEMGGRTEMTGGVLVFDRETADELLAALKKLAAKLPDQRKKLATEFGVDVANPIVVKELSEQGLLQATAPLFSSIWLSNFLDKALNPQPRAFTNSDGDDLVLVTLRYPLAPGVGAEQVRTALGTIESLSPASESFWNWIRLRKTRSSGARTPGKKGGLKIITTREDGSVVLGTVELKGDMLMFGANSIERAEGGRKMLETALGQLVSEPSVEKQTPAELMAGRDDKKQAPSLDLPPAEARAIVHGNLDRMYRQQLDEPVPMLGNVSPRKAVRSKAGREMVVAWLKTLENRMEHVAHDDPMAGYDLRWMWEELGVLDRRR